MAETTEFDHDQLGHLLADHLLEVPRFQRSFSWDESNVDEYLSDLDQARVKKVSYFMGTVVFAVSSDSGGRRQIVDGQQRLATTAILLIAIRDRLRGYGKKKQADAINERFLRGYVLSVDDDVERLILSPKDQFAYDALLEERADDLPSDNPLKACYHACAAHLKKLAPQAKDYRKLLEVSTQVEQQVQVLVAVASDLPEAYVIFETLNDRGADLTTADLLKNYLFSASKHYFNFVESQWTSLESNFEKPDDLVKFLRYEYVSRKGPTSSRKLYRSIQTDVNGSSVRVKKYIQGLIKAQAVYGALREPESPFWADVNVDVRDALYAYRRFGFEASFPVLIAAFQTWKKVDAAKLLVKVAKWSVRAQFAGRLGGGVAEDAFGETAARISDKTVTNQTGARDLLGRIIPPDSEFILAFTTYGDISVSRAKYLLAMLEKASDEKAGRPERALEWYSRNVTIEHILPQSVQNSTADPSVINQIGNLALLEKKLNHQAGSKPFINKRELYEQSQYVLTKDLAAKQDWNAASVSDRTVLLSELACRSWPMA
ncbi:DUF262 domain-containing protein [Paeniglutamicibacter antarcticus]|uniref:DUF262 domain-containing protein n=1 Tax=Arthrobacter terrae TaxID=2935737 RepID=A0A931CUR6_9MICC|nr:DUF262 domain-containing protein [Arthrobacter terrae]MBG0741316.1 DUF262 domain-containing protein [Arthrobacter terrae]